MKIGEKGSDNSRGRVIIKRRASLQVACVPLYLDEKRERERERVNETGVWEREGKGGREGERRVSCSACVEGKLCAFRPRDIRDDFTCTTISRARAADISAGIAFIPIGVLLFRLSCRTSISRSAIYFPARPNDACLCLHTLENTSNMARVWVYI